MTNLVEVTGGNKFQRDIAHKTIAFMIKKLMPRMRLVIWVLKKRSLAITK
jgi:hypothetical protein